MKAFYKIKNYIKSLTRDEKKEVRRLLKDDTGGGDSSPKSFLVYTYATFLCDFGEINPVHGSVIVEQDGVGIFIHLPFVEGVVKEVKIISNNLVDDFDDDVTIYNCNGSQWSEDDTCKYTELADIIYGGYIDDAYNLCIKFVNYDFIHSIKDDSSFVVQYLVEPNS